MDPKQTLLDACDAIEAGELETAQTLLDAYSDWRNQGGFEPDMRGDMLADVLRQLFEAIDA